MCCLFSVFVLKLMFWGMWNGCVLRVVSVSPLLMFGVVVGNGSCEELCGGCIGVLFVLVIL